MKPRDSSMESLPAQLVYNGAGGSLSYTWKGSWEIILCVKLMDKAFMCKAEADIRESLNVFRRHNQNNEISLVFTRKNLK